ncbi:MAG: NADH:flavin oxidoreductase [Gammaproteobacteria bacterium]|nr:NADH:flavin oxidoreductase [Gammaproteobacteria bacterium]
MWKPPERIKYIPSSQHWPSQEVAAKSMLFSPIRLGPITLKNRTWVPAMVPWRSNEQGEVTDDVLQWYERFAQGKPGALVVEATGIRNIPSGPLLRISHDNYIPGLRDLVDTVRKASAGETKIFIQLIDFLSIRRRPKSDKFLSVFLQITDVHRSKLNSPTASDEEMRMALGEMDVDALQHVLSEKEWEDMQYGYRERVTDTHLAQIDELPMVLPTLFGEAAARAEQAGFDGVELHYAHAYTMASFLSATNTRADGYGGSLKERLRLPIEVYDAVRSATSSSFVVGCRFLSDEIIEGGSTLEDACLIADKFAHAGMDFLSLSRGGKFDDAKQPKVGWTAYPYTGRSGYECMPGYISDAQGPFGRNIEPVAEIRRRIREQGFNTPVVVAGGQYAFDQAEAVLQESKADIVGFARQALADPDWFEKVRTGHGEQVRLCRYSNYCEGLDQKHKQVTCELWDREQRDAPGVSLSTDKKRRLIAPAWRREDPA